MKITSELNKALLPLVDEEGNFTKAPPALFGMDFAQRSDEFMDQVKALRATITKQVSRPQPFRVGPPVSLWGTTIGSSKVEPHTTHAEEQRGPPTKDVPTKKGRVKRHFRKGQIKYRCYCFSTNRLCCKTYLPAKCERY